MNDKFNQLADIPTMPNGPIEVLQAELAKTKVELKNMRTSRYDWQLNHDLKARKLIAANEEIKKLKMQASTESPQICDYQKEVQIQIAKTCDELKGLLIAKNKSYGNSALSPIRIFSKADSVEQIKVRIDDKLNRVKNQENFENEDTINDLIGYLILLKIKLKKRESNEVLLIS